MVRNIQNVDNHLRVQAIDTYIKAKITPFIRTIMVKKAYNRRGKEAYDKLFVKIYNKIFPLTPEIVDTNSVLCIFSASPINILFSKSIEQIGHLKPIDGWKDLLEYHWPKVLLEPDPGISKSQYTMEKKWFRRYFQKLHPKIWYALSTNTWTRDGFILQNKGV
jgi:hypothetical protein